MFGKVGPEMASAAHQRDTVEASVHTLCGAALAAVDRRELSLLSECFGLSAQREREKKKETLVGCACGCCCCDGGGAVYTGFTPDAKVAYVVQSSSVHSDASIVSFRKMS